jgi:hypothetical protein
VLKVQIPGPLPRVLIQQIWNEAQKEAFLRAPLFILMLEFVPTAMLRSNVSEPGTPEWPHYLILLALILFWPAKCIIV